MSFSTKYEFEKRNNSVTEAVIETVKSLTKCKNILPVRGIFKENFHITNHSQNQVQNVQYKS